MNNYTVYMHIAPNDKKYIGITCNTLPERWKNGKGYYSQYFGNAIKKYGWKNIQHISICAGLTQEEAQWLEKELIKIWKTTDKKYGYNISEGGYVVSQQTKDKISKGNKGRIHSEESRKHMSDAHIGIMAGENHPMYGKKHSEESKHKMSESHKGKCGKDHPRSRPVFCITTKRIFDNAPQGAEFYNIKNARNINACCNGTKKSCGKLNGMKLIWKYIDIIEI